MSNLKKLNLGFFLTEKMSLHAWDKHGMLTRELAPYNKLAKEFHKIYLFTYFGESELKFKRYLADNIEIVYKRERMPGSWYRWLMPFLRLRQVRSCHIFKTNQFKVRASLIAKIINPKAKLVIRTGYIYSRFILKQLKNIPWWVKLWEQHTFKRADIIFVASQGDKDYVSYVYQINRYKIEVIPNYIDTNLFKLDSEVKKYEDRVLFFGKIDPQKNIELLINALAGTRIKLDIAGGVLKKVNGDVYRQELLNIAKEKEVQISLLGRIPNEIVPSVLNKYKVFILPSLYEGTPKTLLEAMSCSLGCIATDVEGSCEVIKHEYNGLLVDLDELELKLAIQRLFADSSLLLRLGQNAREDIMDNYSLDKYIQKEISIYEKLTQ